MNHIEKEPIFDIDENWPHSKILEPCSVVILINVPSLTKSLSQYISVIRFLERKRLIMYSNSILMRQALVRQVLILDIRYIIWRYHVHYASFMLSFILWFITFFLTWVDIIKFKITTIEKTELERLDNLIKNNVLKVSQTSVLLHKML